MADAVPFGSESVAPPDCRVVADAPRRILCSIDRRYAADPPAARLARQFYERAGGIAGVATERDLDRDWRGGPSTSSLNSRSGDT